MEILDGMLKVLLFVVVGGLVTARYQLTQRVNVLEVRLEKLLLHVGYVADANPPATDDVAVLAQTPGAKVAAIKAYQKQTGANLSDSKAAVERLMAKDD